MQADQAIRRVSRDVFVVWAVHVVLFVAVVIAMTLASAVEVSPMLLAAIPCTLWILLAANGMREARNAMHWPGLIASGQLDQAEREIERAIRAFSLIRSVKIMSLHHLALLRLAQRKWNDAAALSNALLSMSGYRDASLNRASLLILASAAGKVGDLQRAFSAIARLRAMELTLDEQLALLAAESAYLARVGGWQELLTAIDQKVRLAELMPTEASVQTQAYMLLGALHCNRSDWVGYLKGRCELLGEPARLVAEEPLFGDIWSGSDAAALPAEEKV